MDEGEAGCGMRDAPDLCKEDADSRRLGSKFDKAMTKSNVEKGSVKNSIAQCFRCRSTADVLGALMIEKRKKFRAFCCRVSFLSV